MGHTEPLQPAADQAKRKRLGQYFTGQRLAHLLTILANTGNYHSAIDPMCGSGDMLVATSTVMHEADLFGIEIDAEIYVQCVSRLQEIADAHSMVIQGSAFDDTVLQKLPYQSFDLVITNPPYVRYQSLFAADLEGQSIPSHNEVRAGLSRILDRMEHIDERTREVFRTLINSYSGLSDLAVPSWLLCAILTRIGGTLAMVVPASWLSRDYSQVIHYLLLKLFKIRLVVEDAHSVWFDDALVNTTLLLAERIPIVDDLQADWENQSYLHAIVTRQAADARSVVGAIFPDAEDPDTAFRNHLITVDARGEARDIPFTTITRHAMKQKCENLFASAGKSSWLQRLEPSLARRGSSSAADRLILPVLPQRLKDLLPANYNQPFTTLQELGLQVGQGLRTGGNRFFYVDVLELGNSISRIRTDDVFGVDPFKIENNLLRRVLRRQSEVTPSFELTTSNLTGRVLVLEGYYLPEELDKIERLQASMPFAGQPLFRVMNETLARYVRAAATTNIGTTESPRYVPELSAVKTNQTRANRLANRPQRSWYMLPSFAPRHIPDLFVARINHLHPRVVKNSEEKTIIDANFSTFWTEEKPVTDVYGFLSLLNSSWCLVAMELMGTVMGGGALKLEATHLKQLPIPSLSASDWQNMSYYGKQLLVGDGVESKLERVDSIIASTFCSEYQIAAFNSNLRALNEVLLHTRTRGNI